MLLDGGGFGCSSQAEATTPDRGPARGGGLLASAGRVLAVALLVGILAVLGACAPDHGGEAVTAGASLAPAPPQDDPKGATRDELARLPEQFPLRHVDPTTVDAVVTDLAGGGRPR